MTTVSHEPPRAARYVGRRYEYKVLDTGSRIEDEQRAGRGGLARGRRDDEEAAVHRAASGDHPHA